MRFSLLFVLVVGVGGCATAKLLPESDRTVSFTEETKADKEKAFERAHAYLASRLGDSNKAIKMKNKDAGHIVAHSNVECNELRQSGDINEYFLSYIFDAKFKDSKAKIVFSNLKMIGEKGSLVGWSYNQMTSKENVDNVKPCILAVKNEIMGAINKEDDF